MGVGPTTAPVRTISDVDLGSFTESSPVPPLTCDRHVSSSTEAQYTVQPVRDVTVSEVGDEAAKPENYDPTGTCDPPQSFSSFHPRFYLLRPIDTSRTEAMDWGLTRLHSSSGLLSLSTVWLMILSKRRLRPTDKVTPEGDDEEAIMKRHILFQFLACMVGTSSVWQFISY